MRKALQCPSPPVQVLNVAEALESNSNTVPYLTGYQDGYSEGFKRGFQEAVILQPQHSAATKSRHQKDVKQCQFLDVFQAAEFLNLSVSQVRLYAKKKVLRRAFFPDPLRPGHKLRRLLFDRDEIKRFGEVSNNA